MGLDSFDPFEAWKEFTTRDILKEDLDISKLHEPEDFAKEVGEFVTETSANLKALQDFSHHHEVARTNPRFGAALDKVAQAIEGLKKEHMQLRLPKAPVESAGPGKVFKKV